MSSHIGDQRAAFYAGAVSIVVMIMASGSAAWWLTRSADEQAYWKRQPAVWKWRVADIVGDGYLEPQVVHIPGGNFLMGSSADERVHRKGETPVHGVLIAPFSIGKYEVTFEEYDRFAEATGQRKPPAVWGRDRHPVINISWEAAHAYAEWLAEQTGQPYRLPTEAEWEYAARAGSQTPFNTGQCITGEQANFDDVPGRAYSYCSASGEQVKQTREVGQYPPNAFGLYDTHGNVSEWVQDCWHHSYMNAPGEGQAWLETENGNCNQRVVRGGSWGSFPESVRSAVRDWDYSDGGGVVVGFRLARDL